MTTRTRLGSFLLLGPIVACRPVGHPDEFVVRLDAVSEKAVGTLFEMQTTITPGEPREIVQELSFEPEGVIELVGHDRGDGTGLRFVAQDRTEIANWSLLCTSPGVVTISAQTRWYETEGRGLDEGADPIELRDASTTVRCTDGEDSGTSGGEDPTDDDPTDDDPTDDDPTDDMPPSGAEVDVYLGLDDETVVSWTWRRDTGIERSEADPTPLAHVGLEMTASPGGDVVLVASDAQIQGLIRDPADGALTPVATVETYDGHISTLTVAADGETVLATDLFVDVTEITKWELLPGGVLGQRFSFPVPDFPSRPATSGDAGTLYVPLDVAGGALQVFDFFGTDAAPQLRTTVDVPENSGNAAIMADGSCLFFRHGMGVAALPLEDDGTPGDLVPIDLGGSAGEVRVIGDQPRVLLDGAFVPDGDLSVYDVAGDCSLSPAGSIPRESWTLVSDPIAVGDEAVLIEADDSGDAWAVTIDAEGTIERGELVELPSAPVSLLALPRE